MNRIIILIKNNRVDTLRYAALGILVLSMLLFPILAISLDNTVLMTISQYVLAFAIALAVVTAVSSGLRYAFKR